MAIANFIPEVWSARIFQAYDKNFVFGQLVNRDYEGEISQYGDTVRINELSSPTVNTYTANSTTISYETLTDAQKVLLIDKSYYVSYQFEDIDQVQSKPKLLDEAARKAGVALANQVDSNIAGLYTSAGTVIGSTGTADSVGSTGIQKVTSTTLTSLLATVNKELDEKNAPRDGRWIVGPAWFDGLVGLSGIAKDTNNSNVLSNAYVGRYMGFDIYWSNNVNADSTNYWNIMAGNNDAMTWAGQLARTEAVRLEGQFSDGFRSLLLYGQKVIRPNALVNIYATTTEV